MTAHEILGCEDLKLKIETTIEYDTYISQENLGENRIQKSPSSVMLWGLDWKANLEKKNRKNNLVVCKQKKYGYFQEIKYIQYTKTVLKLINYS